MDGRLKFQDIMGMESIEIDYMVYLLNSAFIIFIALIIYFLFKYFLKKGISEPTKEERAFSALKNIDLDLDDEKQLLYDFTIYAKGCVKSEDEERLNSILKKIEPLKYKKEEIELSEEIKNEIRGYIKDASL